MRKDFIETVARFMAWDYFPIVIVTVVGLTFALMIHNHPRKR